MHVGDGVPPQLRLHVGAGAPGELFGFSEQLRASGRDWLQMSGWKGNHRDGNGS
jgi:hypothetical protein